MSEVLLGQSYYLRFDPKLWAAMQPYPPLGTLYAAAYLRERGYDVAAFDAVLADSEAGWAQSLDREQPRIAVLYEDNFNYLSKMCLLRMRQAAFAMIGMARERGCTVVVGGSDATDHAEDYLARGAHFVLIGEGELTLAELVDRLTGRTDTPFESIQGLAFLAGQETGVGDPPLTRTPRRADLSDLDALPFPAWDLIDLPSYQSRWRRRHGYFSINVVTSRGCPYHCSWCAKPIWGQRYHTRSPENVVAELKLLRDRYQPDHLWFADDILGLKPGWMESFADLVEQEGVRIPFKSLHRADLLLKGDTMRALARAGARTVWIGAESGSQRILDAMDKGVRVEQVYQAAEGLHARGVEVGFFLQFGYPGETRADIEKTLQMVRDCRPDDLGVAVSYPLQGTKFHEAVKLELGAKQNWEDSSDLAMMYRGPFTTGFYRQLHRVVHHEFRARKAWDALRGVGARQVTPGRQPLRQAAGFLRNTLTLPWERLQLERLARVPHQGLGQLSRTMTPEAAATPTQQD